MMGASRDTLTFSEKIELPADTSRFQGGGGVKKNTLYNYNCDHDHYHFVSPPVEAVEHYIQLQPVPPETLGAVESVPGDVINIFIIINYLLLIINYYHISGFLTSILETPVTFGGVESVLGGNYCS